MQIFIREIGQLLLGPELAAVLLIWLLPGAGESAVGRVIKGGSWSEDGVGRIAAVLGLPDLAEGFQRLLPPLR
ncbi:MAG: hypothetical protein RMI94_09800 [Bryobacterales bacterium]|nr:hypothetical protein [Bryobacterales bacterium]